MPEETRDELTDDAWIISEDPVKEIKSTNNEPKTKSPCKVENFRISMIDIIESRVEIRQIRNRKCIVFNPAAPDEKSYHDNVDWNNYDEAHIFTAGSAFDKFVGTELPIIFIILFDEEPKLLENGMKSKIENHLSNNFIAIAQKSPNNRIVRTHIAKVLGRFPPDEITSYEGIKQWIESTFWPGRERGQDRTNVPVPQEQNQTIGMPLTFRTKCKEYGTAKYSCRKEVRMELNVTLADVREALVESGGSDWSGMFRELIDAKCREAEDTGDWEYEDYDYNDHQADDDDEDTDRTIAGNFDGELGELKAFVQENDHDLYGQFE